MHAPRACRAPPCLKPRAVQHLQVLVDGHKVSPSPLLVRPPQFLSGQQAQLSLEGPKKSTSSLFLGSPDPPGEGRGGIWKYAKTKCNDKGRINMVHVARGSEPRLSSFFDLRVVFGRSMVNLYSVAKIRARAIILFWQFCYSALFAYMDRRPGFVDIY